MDELSLAQRRAAQSSDLTNEERSEEERDEEETSEGEAYSFWGDSSGDMRENRDSIDYGSGQDDDESAYGFDVEGSEARRSHRLMSVSEASDLDICAPKPPLLSHYCAECIEDEDEVTSSIPADLILHTTVHDFLVLHPETLDRIVCIENVTQDHDIRPHRLLDQVDRLNFLEYIPEMGLALIASQRGVCAVISISQHSTRSLDIQARVVKYLPLDLTAIPLVPLLGLTVSNHHHTDAGLSFATVYLCASSNLFIMFSYANLLILFWSNSVHGWDHLWLRATNRHFQEHLCS